MLTIFCSQRFYKLKREADDIIAKAGGDTPSTPATKSTLAQAKASATPKSTIKSSKRKADADDALKDTPSKKAKKDLKSEEGKGDTIEVGKKDQS